MSFVYVCKNCTCLKEWVTTSTLHADNQCSINRTMCTSTSILEYIFKPVLSAALETGAWEAMQMNNASSSSKQSQQKGQKYVKRFLATKRFHVMTRQHRGASTRAAAHYRHNKHASLGFLSVRCRGILFSPVLVLGEVESLIWRKAWRKAFLQIRENHCVEQRHFNRRGCLLI